MISHSGKIDQQREYFVALSQAVVNINKVFGVKQGTYYEQFCPMANNKEGAYWLSNESGIRNPYFGDKMMTCGEVKNTIDKNYHVPEPKPSASNPNMSEHHH